MLNAAPDTASSTIAPAGTFISERTERIAEHSERIAEDVDVIRIQNEIERLDREWVMSREKFMVRGKDGEMSVPSKTGSIIAGIICTVLAILWIARASLTGEAMPGLWIGVLFIATGLFTVVRGATAASAYETSRRSYEANRGRLMRKLRDRSKPA